MKERPIIFSGPMVLAVRAGTKTQTRRIVSAREFQESETLGYDWTFRDRRGRWQDYGHTEIVERSPYGKAGDRLWVREAFTHITGNGIRVHYRADGEPTDREGRVLPTEPGLRRWMSPLYMPRKLSRVTLEVVEIRVQRLHELTESDAAAEGVEPIFTRFPNMGRDQRLDGELCADAEHRAAFKVLWDEINGDRALWVSNPWVWAVTFKRIEADS